MNKERKFKVGDRVQAKNYGEGVITELCEFNLCYVVKYKNDQITHIYQDSLTLVAEDLKKPEEARPNVENLFNKIFPIADCSLVKNQNDKMARLKVSFLGSVEDLMQVRNQLTKTMCLELPMEAIQVGDRVFWYTDEKLVGTVVSVPTVKGAAAVKVLWDGNENAFSHSQSEVNRTFKKLR